jgi:hypothetical protein
MQASRLALSPGQLLYDLPARYGQSINAVAQELEQLAARRMPAE